MKKSFIGFFALLYLFSLASHAEKVLTTLFEELHTLIAVPDVAPVLIINKEYAQEAAKNSCDFIRKRQALSGVRDFNKCALSELYKSIVLHEQVKIFGSEDSLRSAIREQKFSQNQPAVVRVGYSVAVLKPERWPNVSATAYEFFQLLIEATENLKNDSVLGTNSMVNDNYEFLLQQLTEALRTTRKLQGA
jgi:hypothetical protein